jgi:hypothetical protein
MHVDDGQAVYNSRSLYDSLIVVLEQRYGPLVHHLVTDSFLGQTVHRNKRGAVSYSMSGYITKLAKTHGVSEHERVSTPSSTDLFKDPPTNSTPYPLKKYQQLLGGLVYTVKIRHDIRKEVVYLASRTTSPTYHDYIKARRVLVYLQTTKYLGPTFYTDEGVLAYGHADAAYGVHSNYQSQSGFSISIGRFSAPVCSYTGSQKCISTSSMESEYVCLTECGKRLTFVRALLEDLGFPQDAPSIIFEDNESAIKLAVAPQIPRKSRHIHIRHHYIRELVHLGQIEIRHLRTASMVADLFTKPLAAAVFIPFRDQLLNVKHLVLPPGVTL